MNAPASEPLCFGRFELQAHERKLLVDGKPVAIGARAFDLLLALARRPGHLLSKQDLMDLVWPGRVVEENNLAAQVCALRKVLGGDVIATIPGCGYRFVAPVSAAGPQSAEADREAAGAAPAQTSRTHLPPVLPALLGRADELRALGALVARSRMVSIVGPGGMGKSLLAQHLLDAQRSAYPQGVCWVELSAQTDARALPGAIAAALGVDLGTGDATAALMATVAPLAMLLALDNAEHLAGDVALLCQPMLDAAPELRLLVTSQVPLRLAMEHVYRLGPLAVPEGLTSIEQALEFGSLALFAERAQAVDSRFELAQPSDVSAAIDVCRALDGVPLAIELAAARAPMLGMQQLLSSMQERLRLLTTSRNRAAPARQRTLRAAFEWSHGLLAEREQRVFRRLGVMAGSASLEFIQAVLSDPASGIDTWDVLDALDVLVDRSLAAVLPGEDEAAPRYRLLESARACALERLDAAGERQEMRRRHALALSERFDAAYVECFSGRIGIEDWLRGLAADLDHARDALAWSRAAGDVRCELTIAATLLRALPPSLHAERMALADACEAGMAAAVPVPLQLRGWLELSCAWADTQKQRSREAARRALTLARRLDRPGGDRFPLYYALCRAASAAAQAGDVESAHAFLTELRTLEDPGWPAQRLLWGAEAAQVVARLRGEAPEALRLCRRLVALDRARGGDGWIALGNLVDAELAADDPGGAARAGVELVASLQHTRDEYSLAFARLNLCAAWLALDQTADARAIAQVAWPRAVSFELQHCAAAYLALLASMEGRPRTAARLIGYAEALYAAREEAREKNEQVAMERAGTTARQALGDDEFERLRAEGAALPHTVVAALAFGDRDVE